MVDVQPRVDIDLRTIMTTLYVSGQCSHMTMVTAYSELCSLYSSQTSSNRHTCTIMSLRSATTSTCTLYLIKAIRWSGDGFTENASYSSSQTSLLHYMYMYFEVHCTCMCMKSVSPRARPLTSLGLVHHGTHVNDVTMWGTCPCTWISVLVLKANGTTR